MLWRFELKSWCYYMPQVTSAQFPLAKCSVLSSMQINPRLLFLTICLPGPLLVSSTAVRVRHSGTGTVWIPSHIPVPLGLVSCLLNLMGNQWQGSLINEVCNPSPTTTEQNKGRKAWAVNRTQPNHSWIKTALSNQWCIPWKRKIQRLRIPIRLQHKGLS